MIDKIKALLKEDLDIIAKTPDYPCFSFSVTIEGEDPDENLPEVNVELGPVSQEFWEHSRNVFESRVKALEIALDALEIASEASHEPGCLLMECTCSVSCSKNALKEIARCLGVE